MLMRHRRLDDWLEWLRSGRRGDIELGLERVSRVAARLDVLHPAPTVVKVAGTNGKGSCVAMLEAVLADAGYRVAAYTSPVIERFEECLHVDGARVTETRWLVFCSVAHTWPGDSR